MAVDETKKLKQIMDLGLELTRIKDVDVLLERVLSEARNFVNADAGSIYIAEGDKLKIAYTQNDTLQYELTGGKKLIYSTFTVPINHKSISGHVASTGDVLNISDVDRLPEGAPYSFDKHYDELSNYNTKSMLTFPLKNHREDVVGVLQLINAKQEDGTVTSFSEEDEPFVMYFANNAATAIERAMMTRDIILRMIGMAQLRDPKETGAHVNRVASYAVEIYEDWATRMGITGEELTRNRDILRMAAMLHDVGKVAISDTILKKPGRLDKEEFAIMKEHTFLGARLFANKFSDFDEAACIVALDHHERWDGNGYPGHIDAQSGKPLAGYELENGKARGKKGEETHPFGRVVAVADVFDALSSKRSYKDAWPEARVLDTMQESSGTQFDPEIIKSFFSILDIIRMIADRYPEEE